MSFEMAELNRRGAAALAMALGTGVIIRKAGIVVAANAEEKGDEDVSATEDLMREHGVLRRTLIVYAELARRLRHGNGMVDSRALADAAKLFHDFGEEYHEKSLEETYIFPEVRKAGGPHEKLVEVLLTQHQRGREITGYLLHIGERGNIGGNAVPLGKALDAMSRMYDAHAAWEDTVLFPAWKKLQSKSRLEDLAETFEDIEHKTFGKDGFDDALARISHVEQELGLDDLAAYTAGAPPP